VRKIFIQRNAFRTCLTVFPFPIGNLVDESNLRLTGNNDRTISVIIGNPPYNAHQENFNQRNANRLYTGIDKAIKSTYIKEGTAQNQIVVYDMYTRFFRWASNRLGQNGIIAFITNRSFIDSKTFDGFRKCIDREFDYVYIVDTQSDVRNNPRISGTKNNVFGIQTGISVMFLVRTAAENKK
jgi:predicted helicase